MGQSSTAGSFRGIRRQRKAGRGKGQGGQGTGPDFPAWMRDLPARQQEDRARLAPIGPSPLEGIGPLMDAAGIHRIRRRQAFQCCGETFCAGHQVQPLRPGGFIGKAQQQGLVFPWERGGVCRRETIS